ncbi:hypothetical protein [Isoptericola croceus]|uniref:hypothetical protein n=1 Tax=Isoptericola croceus TaxID=3031406 RepID=UPI0023F68429|nr:hypothetical protein [Isoptericola croceus]
MSLSDLSPATLPEAAPARVDLRSVALSGVATFAWYAVPDLVRPRWARALAKTAVLTTAVALALATTREGEEARGALREVQDQVRGAVDQADEQVLDQASAAVEPGTGRAVAAGAALVGGLALAGTVAVLGERWAYRTGERLGERGLRAPHSTVGLVLGAAAAGLAAVEGPLSAGRSRSAAA